MNHLLRIYFKLCPNDSYFNSREKSKKLNLYQDIFTEDVVTIRFLSKFIANLVAAFPAVTLGLLYYKALETDKAKAL